MVKMNTAELFRDLPSDAPISASAGFRIVHGIRAQSNNGDRHEMRAAMSQSRTGSGWALSSSGQPTVSCSGGYVFYDLEIRLGIDILHSSAGGAITNLGGLNRTVGDIFGLQLDDYRRGASAPQMATSHMPRFVRRRGVLVVSLDPRPLRCRLVTRGGPVQKWKVTMGYNLSISANFTAAQVGRGNARYYLSTIEAAMHFFVDQPRV